MVFGAEPKDVQVYWFLLDNYKELRFGCTDDENSAAKKNVSPKRIQREAKKAVFSEGIGTKAQIALKKLRDEGKTERKKCSVSLQHEDKLRWLEEHKQKRLKKHKGH